MHGLRSFKWQEHSLPVRQKEMKNRSMNCGFFQGVEPAKPGLADFFQGLEKMVVEFSKHWKT